MLRGQPTDTEPDLERGSSAHGGREYCRVSLEDLARPPSELCEKTQRGVSPRRVVEFPPGPCLRTRPHRCARFPCAMASWALERGAGLAALHLCPSAARVRGPRDSSALSHLIHARPPAPAPSAAARAASCFLGRIVPRVGSPGERSRTTERISLFHSAVLPQPRTGPGAHYSTESATVFLVKGTLGF